MTGLRRLPLCRNGTSIVIPCHQTHPLRQSSSPQSHTHSPPSSGQFVYPPSSPYCASSPRPRHQSRPPLCLLQNGQNDFISNTSGNCPVNGNRRLDLGRSTRNPRWLDNGCCGKFIRVSRGIDCWGCWVGCCGRD